MAWLLKPRVSKRVGVLLLQMTALRIDTHV